MILFQKVTCGSLYRFKGVPMYEVRCQGLLYLDTNLEIHALYKAVGNQPLSCPPAPIKSGQGAEKDQTFYLGF